MANRERVSVDNFRRVMCVPVYKDACILRPSPTMVIIHSTFRIYDLDRMEKRKCTKSFFLADLESLAVADGGVQDSSSELLIEYNRETLQQVILKKNEKCGRACLFIEIWNSDSHLQTYSTCDIKAHGEIYHCGNFKSVCWSPFKRNMILYVAEKDASEPCLSKKESFWKDKGAYSDDWGEMHEGKRSSVICTLNVDNGEVSVLSIFKDMDLTLGQATWIGENSIAFVAWDEKPFQLGILHCTNRKSTLYSHELHSNVTRQISDGTSSVRSPRVSHDGNLLVYLQNSIGGPHKKCSCMMKYDLRTCTNETVIGVIKETTSVNGFPGIYTDDLPRNCWTKNNEYVIFSSNWRSERGIIVLNVHSGKIAKVEIPWCAGNAEVLDVYDDLIVAKISSLHVEPFLVIGKVMLDGVGIDIVWQPLDLETPTLMKELDFSVVALDPIVKHETFTCLDYEIILVTPDSSEIKVHPALIVWPHGGPHSVFSTEFSMFAAAFALEGFSVCLVNYRGSIGFGEDNLNSLIGKIGSQDIIDVHHAGTYAKERISSIQKGDIDIFLFGGSHGGFIVSHLCAKFPGYYKACVCRNPVTNLAGMIEGTDIPDWVWAESGLGNYDENFYTKMCPKSMWEMSPLSVADKVDTPTLILLGKNDRRVPPSQGLAYYRVLKSTGVSVKVFMYDSNHALDSAVATSQSLYQSCKFFKENATVQLPE